LHGAAPGTAAVRSSSENQRIQTPLQTLFCGGQGALIHAEKLFGVASRNPTVFSAPTGSDELCQEPSIVCQLPFIGYQSLGSGFHVDSVVACCAPNGFVVVHPDAPATKYYLAIRELPNPGGDFRIERFNVVSAHGQEDEQQGGHARYSWWD
jgi:hypothetical protein